MSFWESFWSIIWWFFWVFVFAAYLLALFTVLIDIFRDASLKGWAKALWVVFLVFVPFITAVVYLIARGDGMSERSTQAARAQREVAEDYIRDVAGTSPTTEIEKATTLLDAGHITQEEFAQLKAKALA